MISDLKVKLEILLNEKIRNNLHLNRLATQDFEKVLNWGPARIAAAPVPPGTSISATPPTKATAPSAARKLPSRFSFRMAVTSS